MSNDVFVIDTNKQSQNPVHPAQARLLLSQGQAAVDRRYLFTIILKEPKPESKIARGLYKTAQGQLLNADVNGSLNIIKKVIPDVLDQGIKG